MNKMLSPPTPHKEPPSITIQNQKHQIDLLLHRVADLNMALEECRGRASDANERASEWKTEFHRLEVELEHARNARNGAMHELDYMRGYIARVKEEDSPPGAVG